MKRLLPAALVLSLLTGCSRHYVMTLNNGSRVSCVGKPKLVEGNYVTKDERGQKLSISAGRVREISPASMVVDEKAQFTK